MLRICSLSALELGIKHCLYLFLCIVVRQCYEMRKRSRIRSVQMDNLRGLLSIWRMDRIPNVQIRELCGVKHEWIDEGVVPPCGEDEGSYDCQESLCRRVCW